MDHLLHDEELLGSVALKGEEIDDLIVNPKYQRQGYGRKILLWALSHMNSERIFLHVADWNQRAIHLYQKNGFVITKSFEITRERFDYTKWQRDHFDMKTPEQISAEATAYVTKHPYAGDPASII